MTNMTPSKPIENEADKLTDSCNPRQKAAKQNEKRRQTKYKKTENQLSLDTERQTERNRQRDTPLKGPTTDPYGRKS